MRIIGSLLFAMIVPFAVVIGLRGTLPPIHGFRAFVLYGALPLVLGAIGLFRLPVPKWQDLILVLIAYAIIMGSMLAAQLPLLLALMVACFFGDCI